MTEFTREQKKEFLMQELELTQEVRSLEQQLGEYHELFHHAVQYIDMVLNEGKSLNGTVVGATEEHVKKCADIDEILRLCSLLRLKRNNLSDVQSILRMIRG